MNAHQMMGFPIRIYDVIKCCEAGSGEPYPEVVCIPLENVFQEDLKEALNHFPPEYRELLLSHFERM